MPMTYHEITAVLYSLKAGNTVEITYAKNSTDIDTVTRLVDKSWDGMQQMFSKTSGDFDHPLVTLCAKDGSRVNVSDWQQVRYKGGVIRDFGDTVHWTPEIGATAKPISYLKKM